MSQVLLAFLSNRATSFTSAAPSSSSVSRILDAVAPVSMISSTWIMFTVINSAIKRLN